MKQNENEISNIFYLSKKRKIDLNHDYNWFVIVLKIF